VLTRRAAAQLLEGVSRWEGLEAVASAIGFSAPVLPLLPETRASLGLSPAFEPVGLMSGRGALRALLVSTTDASPLSPQVTRLAQRLAVQAAHLRWLIIALGASRRDFVIATCDGGQSPIRVAALSMDTARVLESDAETLASLAGVGMEHDLLCYERWREILSREALSHRFYRTLEHAVHSLADGASGRASPDERLEYALLLTSRLLFLAFLEVKGWLDGDPDFLSRRFAACLTSGGDFHRRVLRPLFFGTLNTRVSRRAPAARAFGRIPFLNGGLFAPSPLERRNRGLVFHDDDFARLFDELFVRYRFTVREERMEWREAAIDPEMLGRAFETLMASRARRSSGAFYTPQPLVERVTEAVLTDALTAGGILRSDAECALRNEPVDGVVASDIAKAARPLRVLDPACGSGAFLVHVLDRLTALQHLAGAVGDVAELRQRILTRSIFGVDVNPTAVWLCELRLWLAVLIDRQAEDPMRVPPLPNLDHNVRVGDSLAGGAFSSGGSRRPSRLATLRLRYATANGARKQTLARTLAREERMAAINSLEERLVVMRDARRSLLSAARGLDLFGRRRGSFAAERTTLDELRRDTRSTRVALRALRDGGALPFAFASHFADVSAAGGFDVVIGNPPWVRLHRIPSHARETYRRMFRVYREAAWEQGARDARAGRGFAAQVDVASLFVERAVSLTRSGGTMGLLVPAKLWRSLAGGGVRRLLSERTTLSVLEDWSDAPSSFDAVVYPSLVVVRRGTRHEDATARLSTHRRGLAIAWDAPRDALPLDDSPGAPWLPMPPDVRAAFDRLATTGVAFARSSLGVATLGVKTGLNEAFLLRVLGRRNGVAHVIAGDREGEVEARLLRPALAGDQLRAWKTSSLDTSILWTHDSNGRPLAELPDGAAQWLASWRHALARRTDARPGGRWWSLFRTDAARSDAPRVVWADVARAPRALVLPPRDPIVPLNTCYVVHTRDLVDAHALAALLNSAIAAAWLAMIAEPARGGYRRYFAWTIARLPIPQDWARARTLLAPLGEAGTHGEAPASSELLEVTLKAYRVRHATVAPLLEWIG
jgi:hypothetical protein